MILNENVHEFDEKEKHSIKDILRDLFYKDTYEEIINQLETEIRMSRVREIKLRKNLKKAIAEINKLNKELHEHE